MEASRAEGMGAIRWAPALTLKMGLAFVAAGAGLLAVYVGLITAAESFSHARQQLQADGRFVGLITVGFSTQAALFVYLRGLHRRVHGPAKALTAGSAGTSTAAMVACCAHHLTDVLPLAGLSGAAIFLNNYKPWFMGVGLVTTAVGVGWMLYRVRQAQRDACAMGD